MAPSEDHAISRASPLTHFSEPLGEESVIVGSVMVKSPPDAVSIWAWVSLPGGTAVSAMRILTREERTFGTVQA